MPQTTFSGNSSYTVLLIPNFITRLYLEYKVTDLNFKDPIDDQLRLYADNGDSAIYLFYNCYGGWNARTIYYNGSESQTTNRGATWPGDGIIGMAIDYTNKYVNFYYDNTLFGKVTLPNTTFRRVEIASACEDRSHHELTIEQRLTKDSLKYPKDGFPCYLDALNAYSALQDIPTDTLRWYVTHSKGESQCGSLQYCVTTEIKTVYNGIHKYLCWYDCLGKKPMLDSLAKTLI